MPNSGRSALSDSPHNEALAADCVATGEDLTLAFEAFYSPIRGHRKGCTVSNELILIETHLVQFRANESSGDENEVDGFGDDFIC
jgi:hypothetical protein